MTENEQQEVVQTQQTEIPPSNYLVFAILTTIFCCQIFGIVSIIYAATVNSKWNAGDKEGAYQASKNARTWALVALLSGAAVFIVTLLLTLFGVIFTGAAGGIDI